MERTLIENIKYKLGEEVTLMGHIKTIRKISKSLTFIHLRERTGVTQIVFRGEHVPIPVESVISVTGVVQLNDQSKFGGMEVLSANITIISEGTTLPITINKKGDVPFQTLVQYPALTLRMEERSHIFKAQSEFLRLYREFMVINGFTEINSTKLVSSGAEGGSSMFEVDYYGERVYLSQSPQLYKQMMVGVFERVFEVGKVYRQEGSNSNRHLSEFIGLEFEMGFIESYEDVVSMEEAMFNYIFEGLNESMGLGLQLPGNIPKITYEEAINISGGVHSEGLTNANELAIGKYVKEVYGNEFVFIMGYPSYKRPFYTMFNGEETSSFELLYGGIEITSGSQRIHNYNELTSRMGELGVSTEGFEEYLLAFKVGMPPHGGCGIGLERVIKQMLGLGNVEEASLIPRTKSRF